MRNKLYILALLTLMPILGFGQVEFTAHLSRDKIGINERLRVDFKMNQNGDNFKPPAFDGFEIYSGPTQSVQENFFNGKRSFSKQYSFYLKPKRRGTLTIGQAEVTINGKIYKTSPKTVQVTKAVNSPKNGKNETIVDISDDIQLVTVVSDPNPYLNQGVSVAYKLYISPDTRVGNLRTLDAPDFPNFWSHDIDIKNLKIKYGSYKGQKNYRIVVLQKAVLYPQKTGELNIQPLTISLSVQVPSHRRDFFGRIIYKSVDKTVASKNIKINVKPLPQKGKPANFSGAVGQFGFSVTASKNSLNANESLDAKVKVSGNGNLKLFQLPKLDVPNVFEAYDPEHSDNVVTNLSGMHGSISDTYTIVPKVKGEYAIPPVSFSYFDPNSGTYKTLRSKKIMIDVKHGPMRAAGVSPNDSTGNSAYKIPVVSSGKHFRYIKLETDLHPIGQSPFFGSKLFWVLVLLPVVLLPVVIVVGRKRKERANDLYGNQLRRANKLSKKYLSDAKRKLGDQSQFYDSLERALHNYLRAKLAIQTTEMSKERIEELLTEKNVNKETEADFIALLKSCEFARYTPSSDVEMQQDYDKASKTISALDKQL